MSKKTIEKQGYKEGVCSICKSMNLEYGSVEPETGCLYYPMECKNCGATGKAFYNVEFTDIIMVKTK